MLIKFAFQEPASILLIGQRLIEQMNIDVWSPSLALFLFVGIVGVAVYLKRRKRSIRQQVEDANNGSDDGGELELVEDDDDDSKASYEDLDEGIEWETLDTIDIN